MKHVHQAVRLETLPFSGTISSAEENQAAHGNVREVEHCQCGAERSTNVNGMHCEVGAWIEPTESQRRAKEAEHRAALMDQMRAIGH